METKLTQKERWCAMSNKKIPKEILYLKDAIIKRDKAKHKFLKVLNSNSEDKETTHLLYKRYKKAQNELIKYYEEKESLDHVA